MECRFTGKNESKGTDLVLSPDGNEDGPGGTYYSFQIHAAHNIQIKKIPGEGNRDITMRVSDVKTASTGPLYDKISMVVYSILESADGSGSTQGQFNEIKKFCEMGGPYDVIWAYGAMTVNISEFTFSVEPGYPDPSYKWYGNFKEDKSSPYLYGKFDISLVEYNKGV